MGWPFAPVGQGQLRPRLRRLPGRTARAVQHDLGRLEVGRAPARPRWDRPPGTRRHAGPGAVQRHGDRPARRAGSRGIRPATARSSRSRATSRRRSATRSSSSTSRSIGAPIGVHVTRGQVVGLTGITGDAAGHDPPPPPRAPGAVPDPLPGPRRDPPGRRLRSPAVAPRGRSPPQVARPRANRQPAVRSSYWQELVVCLASERLTNSSSKTKVTTAPSARPTDATLSVTKAARLLGVHPNTIRAWSDQGRLRYYRINPRGDRRYRLGDLQRFLGAAAAGRGAGRITAGRGGRPATGWPTASAGADRSSAPAPGARLDRPPVGRPAGRPWPPPSGRPRPPIERRRHALDMQVIAELEPARLVRSRPGPDPGPGRPPDPLGLRPCAAVRHPPVARDERSRRGRSKARPWPTAAPGRRRSGPAAGRSTRTGRSWSSGAGAWPGPTARSCPSRGPRSSPRSRASDGPGASSSSASEMADGLTEARPAHGRLPGRRRRRPRRPGPAARGDEPAGPPPRGPPPGRRRHRQQARPRPDPGRDRRPRDGPLRRRAGGRLPAPAATARSWPRSRAACRRPTSPRSGTSRSRRSPAAAMAAREPMFAVHYADDPLGAAMRAAVIQEGFDTMCAAPFFDGDTLLGLAVRLPRPAPPLDARRARHDRRLRGPGQRGDQDGPELRPDGDLGRPAPVDPGPRHPPQPAGDGRGDRLGDRHGAARPDRLPQRPGLPDPATTS